MPMHISRLQHVLMKMAKKYNVSMDDIRAIEDLDEDELQELGLKA